MTLYLLIAAIAIVFGVALRHARQRARVMDQAGETFSALIRNNPFGVYTVDADFRLRDISLGARPTFATLHPAEGRDFNEVLRTLWPEPFASEALARFRHTLETGEPYSAPGTVERRADLDVLEAYDWRIQRLRMPDGRYGVVCYFYDLSERQRLERRVLRSEERLRLATKAAGLGIWTWQPHEDEVVWENDRPYEIFGLARSEPPLTAARFKSTFLHPDDIEAFESAFLRAAETGAPVMCELRTLRRDGTTRWIELTGQAVEGVEPLRLTGTVQDITDRKNAEAALRASEARHSFTVALADALRPLSDPATVPAVAARVLGERVNANRVAWFEVRGDECVVEQDYTDGAPSLAGRHRMASLAAGSMIVPLTRDGAVVAGLAVHSTVPRTWTACEIALFDETADRVWHTLGQLRTEAALRESEERSAFVRQSSGVGFWYCDLPFDTLLWDDLVKAHFHLPPDADVTIQTFYDRIHPEDREPTRRAIEQSIADRTPYVTDYRTVHPETGAITWVRAIGRTFYAADGTPTRFDGVTLDVSEQKRAEAELREADRRKDEFLATLAHELRNPLAPIRNGLELMRLTDVDGRVEPVRSMMERQLGQMIRLVDDLLDVSRVTTGKLELRRERLELRTVIAAALETSQPIIEQAGHQLAVVLPDEPVFVDGDPVRLAQAVSNLLLNSAKYTPRGGHIRVSVAREGAVATVVVADDGIGIPPDMLETVFGLFARVDRTMERSTGGLGIGLSLVRQLVEMHGGTVTARSEGEGRGSAFTVRLPTLPAGGGMVALPHAETTERPESRRILVADDNADAAESLAQWLGMQGHQVRIARDGLQAVELARSLRPDVILLDLAMPRLNGHDACRRIRAEPWAEGATLVAMTGLGQEEDRLRSLDTGFDHHLVKPVDLAALERLLASTVSRRPPRSTVPASR